MPEPAEYKPTFMDRHGPAGGDYVRAFGYGLMVFGLVLGIGMSQAGFSLILLVAAIASGIVTAASGLTLAHVVGSTWKRLMVDGTSTPYKEQYSYQQALVMQGKVDEALESYEAVIAEKPDDVDVRIKAAELYVRERGNAERAAELFREVQRIPDLPVGSDVYASNRLVDLYTGPLNEPGRALVELRRLIDRHPNSAVAKHARDALAELKAKHVSG